MAGYPDWTRPKGWKVTGFGTGSNPNPWSLTINDTLKFGGEGAGSTSLDVITKAGNNIADGCLHNPPGHPLNTVKVKHATGFYKIVRDLTVSPAQLTCRAIASGGIAWTATEGG